MKVIFTGDMCGGSELAMLCIRLLILGLPLTGTVMVLEMGVTTLGTSFSSTGEELEELVLRLLRGFSSSSEQLTPDRHNETSHSFNTVLNSVEVEFSSRLACLILLSCFDTICIVKSALLIMVT